MILPTLIAKWEETCVGRPNRPSAVSCGIRLRQNLHVGVSVVCVGTYDGFALISFIMRVFFRQTATRTWSVCSS